VEGFFRELTQHLLNQYSESNVMQFLLNFLIKNQGPLHVSSITCSSLGGATQTEIDILRACYVPFVQHLLMMSK
jgi:hypothetical protein